MRLILHILTRGDEPLAREIITRQEESEAENKVVVVDLTAGQPDYKSLVENIFAADSVQTW
jgi:hypothetical protein